MPDPLADLVRRHDPEGRFRTPFLGDSLGDGAGFRFEFCVNF